MRQCHLLGLAKLLPNFRPLGLALYLLYNSEMYKSKSSKLLLAFVLKNEYVKSKRNVASKIKMHKMFIKKCVSSFFLRVYYLTST